MFILLTIMVLLGRLNGKVPMVVGILIVLSMIFLQVLMIAWMDSHTDEITGPVYVRPLPDRIDEDIENEVVLGPAYYFSWIIAGLFAVVTFLISRIGNFYKKRELARAYVYSLNFKKASKLYHEIDMKDTADNLEQFLQPSVKDMAPK